MAVYTQLGSEDVSALLLRYDVGDLVALKGIAEGVENSNYFVETTSGRYILTLYENRVDPRDLPFFHSLLAHLHEAGCPVPRFIEDREGRWLQEVAARPACLIEFLAGVSVSHPNAAQAHDTGAALGRMHAALTGFGGTRPNTLGIAAWRPLAEKCDREALETIQPGLADRIFAECDYLENRWPAALPQSVIHADLFPDNVLMLGNRVTGLIDFYFACTDARAYDLAVTLCAWAFSADGKTHDDAVAAAIIVGYATQMRLDHESREALPLLLRGACLRFLLTRSFDWINTPANALVTRKDPIAFLRRLDFYGNEQNIRALMGHFR